MTTFRVIGPLAVIKDGNGMQQYRYRDVTVTDEEFPLDELKRLEGLGLLAKADESDDEDDESDDDEDDEPARAPRRSARRSTGSGD